MKWQRYTALFELIGIVIVILIFVWVWGRA